MSVQNIYMFLCILGAGFIVRCPIGQNGKIPDCDPFLGIDHFGPVEYGPGEAVGTPDHPHRGFETVTYIVEGSSQHKDSAGNSGELKEGWVQWMTAGSGMKSPHYFAIAILCFYTRRLMLQTPKKRKIPTKFWLSYK